ncbi:TPA: ead/Ea22-like family protein [Klebsiella aerogenes]
MKTDITELAQSLKAAAEKATPGRWEYYPGNTSIEYNVDSMDEDQGSIVYVDSGDFTQAQTDRNGEFIALANPANILALVEALEKAQATEAHCNRGWREAHEQEARAEAAEKRIAELESRTVTVKLPSERFRYGDSDYDDGFVNGWNARMAEDTAALDRVGIKWEAE